MIKAPKVASPVFGVSCPFVLLVLFQTFPVDNQALAHVALGLGDLTWIPFNHCLGAPMRVLADEADG